MNQKNILFQLTANLSFKNAKNLNNSTKMEPKVLLKSAPIENLDSNNVKQGQKRAIQESSGDEDSDEEITILNGIKKVSNKKVSKKNKEKNFDQIKTEKMNQLRNINKINTNGNDIPDIIERFDEFNEKKEWADEVIPEILIKNLLGFEYKEATPVQMQSIPVMLNNRELMVCAPTGSGKTLSYLFPILAKLQNHKSNGARALILSPTRELARQIYIECHRLSKGMDLKVKILNKLQNELKNSDLFMKKYDILITTPNKLIYLLEDKKVSESLKKIEWMVIDEADRLFEDGEKGFREQLAKIYKACDNPKIKHALFSATLTNDVQNWFRDYSHNIIEVSIGRKNQSALGIEQELVYVANEAGKLFAIKNLFKNGFEPPILVFVQSKKRANDLFKELALEKINCDVISGDRSQPDRDNAIRSFRTGKTWVLISTELMSRGIDFKYVNLVINYDFPQTAISYIHRIGRSGRAGNMGRAITFFSDEDLPFLRSIANIIREAGCEVPEYMLKLKKPSKKSKRLLAKKAPIRKKINDKN